MDLYREAGVSSQATSKGAPEETSSGARSAKERFGLRPAPVVAEEDIPADHEQRSDRSYFVRCARCRSCHLGYRIVTTAGSLRTLTSAPLTATGTPSTAADRIGWLSGDQTTTPPGGILIPARKFTVTVLP